MKENNIKIIQNLLQQKNRYDIAIKLDGSSYNLNSIDEWNGVESCILELYVHPNSFLELQRLNEEGKTLIIELFTGLIDSFTCIQNLEIKIDKDIEIQSMSDTVYIFVDESGDMDFSKKGSKHYMFHFLVKKRPFSLHEYIANYRYQLLERSLDPLNGKRFNIEYFHAHNDNKYIKNELFNIISSAFQKASVKVYSYILEKSKVHPQKREEKEKFYIDNLTYSISKLLDKLSIDKNFIIITDNLPIAKNKQKQIKALRIGIKEYLKHNNLDLRYDIYHHCSASSVNLQIVDYIGWAIHRKYEMDDLMYFNKIKEYIIDEDIVTKDRKSEYYGK